jgi:hypothetical protein
MSSQKLILPESVKEQNVGKPNKFPVSEDLVSLRNENYENLQKIDELVKSFVKMNDSGIILLLSSPAVLEFLQTYIKNLVPSFLREYARKDRTVLGEATTQVQKTREIGKNGLDMPSYNQAVRDFIQVLSQVEPPMVHLQITEPDFPPVPTPESTVSTSST